MTREVLLLTLSISLSGCWLGESLSTHMLESYFDHLGQNISEARQDIFDCPIVETSHTLLNKPDDKSIGYDGKFDQLRLKLNTPPTGDNIVEKI